MKAKAKTTGGIDVAGVRAKIRRAFKPGMRGAAAYVRGIAVRSISKDKTPAPPGGVVHSPTGRLKRAVLWAIQAAGHTVAAVIGPALSWAGSIGHTHEFGDTEPEVLSKPRANGWDIQIGGLGPVAVSAANQPVTTRLKTGPQVERARRLAKLWPAKMRKRLLKKRRRYPARPFMGPALRRAAERLPSFWANSVRQ